MQQPLEKGENYRVVFYYSLAENSGLISKSIGCSFSDKFAYREVETALGVGHSPLFNLNYTLVEKGVLKLSDTKKWILFQQDYISTGDEKYLYISGVPAKGNSCLKREEVPPVMTYEDYAYYYIDEVSIVKQNKDGSYPIVTPELKMKQKASEAKSHSYSNIYFKTSSHHLDKI